MLPNDPRLKTLTLEQRNFMIACMNNDVLIEQGKQPESGIYDDDDSWLSLPEDAIPFFPNGMSEEDFWEQVTQKVGLETMLNDEKSFKQEAKIKRQQHNAKMGELRSTQESEMERLRKKSKKIIRKDFDDEFSDL